MSVTKLLKSDSTSQDSQMTGCFDFLIYDTQEGMFGGFFPFFKIIFKLSAY